MCVRCVFVCMHVCMRRNKIKLRAHQLRHLGAARVHRPLPLRLLIWCENAHRRRRRCGRAAGGVAYVGAANAVLSAEVNVNKNTCMIFIINVYSK